MSSPICGAETSTHLLPLQVDIDSCEVNGGISPQTDSNSISPHEWSDPSRSSLYERLFGRSEPSIGACADGNGAAPNNSEPATPVGDLSALWVSTIHQMTTPTSLHSLSDPSPNDEWNALSPDKESPLPMYLRDRTELTPEKLAEIRAKDAERKRRWRHKRRMERKCFNAEDSNIEAALPKIETPNHKSYSLTSPIPSDDSPSTTPTSDDKRPLSRRSTLSPDRLKAIRAKDAERKRRARLRKRILTDGLIRHALINEAESSHDTAEVNESESLQNSNHQDGEVSATATQSLILNCDEALVSIGSESLPLLVPTEERLMCESTNETEQAVDVDSLISPRSDGKCRVPRKALPPELLLEVRAKDNARKREQRARRKQAKHFEMASTLLQMMTTSEPSLLSHTDQTIQTPTLLSPSLNAILSPVPSSVINSVPTSLPLSIVLPAMSAFTANVQPSLSAGLRIDVSSAMSPSIGGSAPASLTSISSLPSLPSAHSLPPSSETAALDLLKNFVQTQTSPRSFDDRAAAKRAARAARIAKMTEDEKKHHRAMDRERKRVWRQKRKQEMSGLITCTVTPTSELSKEFIAQISPGGLLDVKELKEEED